MPGAEVGHGLVSAMLGLDFPATTPYSWPKIGKFGKLQGFDGFLKQKPSKTSCGKHSPVPQKSPGGFLQGHNGRNG